MSGSLSYEAQKLSFSGDIVFSTAQSLYASIAQIAFAPNNLFHIDFTKVHQVDSSAIALCLSLKRKSLDAHCEICFENVPLQLQSIAESVGVSELFEGAKIV